MPSGDVAISDQMSLREVVQRRNEVRACHDEAISFHLPHSLTYTLGTLALILVNGS